MASGAKLHENPRLRELEEIFDLEKSAVEDALESVDVAFRANEKKLFDSEGQSGGAKWPALSPEYRARKDRIFGIATAFTRDRARQLGRKPPRGAAMGKVLGAENKILQLTGDMKRAFSTKGGAHVAEAVRRAGRWVLLLGATGPDWYAHHVRGGGHLPQRNPLQHTNEQIEVYRAQARRRLVPHVMRALRASLGGWRRAA